MRIIFGILSSNNTALAIQQIIDTIGPDHTIIIHHDFSKQPEFRVTGNDVHVIDDYVITEWGGWSLVEATIKLMKYALMKPDWDYFQLLSDTCLPIQPIQEFEKYLKVVQPDANISCIAVAKHPEILLSHGLRAFSKKGTYAKKILRKITNISKRMRKKDGYRMIDGLTLEAYINDDRLYMKLIARVLPGFLLKLAAKRIGFTHPFRGNTECYVGSQFFGCSKRVCNMIQEWMDANKYVVNYIKTQVEIPDEFFFQTVIGNLLLHIRAPTNHLINYFDSRTGQGSVLDLSDYDRLRHSGKFFARKFSKNPEDPMRLKILHDIRQI